jgi:hypothetical protein
MHVINNSMLMRTHKQGIYVYSSSHTSMKIMMFMHSKTIIWVYIINYIMLIKVK